jgi:class 3 adenylate cyclase
VRQQAAILFVDLSGFTGLTESLEPAWTRDLLVELHERIERAATDHRGFVVSYMGDGAMIVFGCRRRSPATPLVRWRRSNGFIAISLPGSATCRQSPSASCRRGSAAISGR